jgi:hypothetical protein
VSTPKNKKNAPSGNPQYSSSKRKKEQLIRLDDLIPKKNISGGRQLLFGAPDPTGTINPNK